MIELEICSVCSYAFLPKISFKACGTPWFFKDYMPFTFCEKK
jgi:hypothetical protein